MSARAERPRPRLVNGEFVPTRETPFSSQLDALIAEIREGRAPNLGRFCGYCCTPLGDRRTVCVTCGASTAETPARSKISRPLAAVYTAKRRREARIIHSAAWAGILLGTAISIGLILALPGWTKVFAILFLIVGSYFLATYAGNVLAQNWAYRSGLEFFAGRWQEYQHARKEGSIDDDA